MNVQLDERADTLPQDAKGRLQRQLASAQKAASEVRSDLAAAESARAEQERRLEAAGAQVMRVFWNLLLPESC